MEAIDGRCNCGHVLDRSTDEQCRHCKAGRKPDGVIERDAAGNVVRIRRTAVRRTCTCGPNEGCNQCRLPVSATMLRPESMKFMHTAAATVLRLTDEHFCDIWNHEGKARVIEMLRRGIRSRQAALELLGVPKD